MRMYLVLRPRAVEEHLFDEMCHAFLIFGDAIQIIRNTDGDVRIEIDIVAEEAERCFQDMRLFLKKLAEAFCWSFRLEIGLVEEIGTRTQKEQV